MKCPYCGQLGDKVVDSRESKEGDVIRRRRQCLNGECSKRFTSYERIDEIPYMVVKKDGTRAEFDPTKIRGSMTLALRKRPVSVEQVDAAIERIQDKLLASGAREVPSARVGAPRTVMLFR